MENKRVQSLLLAKMEKLPKQLIIKDARLTFKQLMRLGKEQPSEIQDGKIYKILGIKKGINGEIFQTRFALLRHFPIFQDIC